MPELPTGTVTFLFTDVEGSTRLLREHGERYPDLLAEHRRLLREAFARHHGVEVDTQGDAFFYAFAHASDALAAAEEACRALEPTPVRVRIGVHTGEPIVTAEGYVGMEVHQAARIAASAHGGQVVLSERTARRLEPSNSLLLADLGLHRLKDLGEPVKLFQLGAGEHPPLKTLNATNLPAQPGPLIGREGELDELQALVRSGARMVTLTGAGGSGKTRLALQAAAELVDDFVDGVFWVPLQALTDSELVLPTVASTLGAKGELQEYVDEKRLLLLLDNLEQLLPGAANALAALLAACPNLVLLVTSRALLRIAAEREYVLEPLALADAVTLFRERAPDADPEDAVVEICRRVDGLPLAVELAAARTRLLPPSRLLERLAKTLPLLTGGMRDAPERQRTLTATIAWSYELLDEAEQGIFCRLSVFAGGFEIEAAEQVAEADIDTLESLVEKNLLRRWVSGRLAMLETIHEYAVDRLREIGETDALRNRHAEHYARIADCRWVDLISGGDSGWRETVSADRANLHAALEWSLERKRGEDALAIVSGIWPSLANTGQMRRWIEAALALPSAGTTLRRAFAFAGLSDMGLLQGDLDTAKRAAEEAIAFFRQHDDPRWLSAELVQLAEIALKQGDRAAALRLAEEGLAIRRERMGSRSLGRVLVLLAEIAKVDGDLARAQELLEEAIARIRAEDPGGHHFPLSLAELGDVLRLRGDQPAALAALVEALRVGGGVQDALSITASLHSMAIVLSSLGEREVAARLGGAAERAHQEFGFTPEDEQAVPERVEPAWSEGRAMSLDEAVEYALSAVD